MARRGKVFNRLGRPRLLRKEISSTETVVHYTPNAIGAIGGRATEQFEGVLTSGR